MISGTRISRTQGTEGPLQDPYGYDEWTVCRRNMTIVIHAGGLLTWIKVNDVLEDYYDEAKFVKAIEHLVGVTPDVLIRSYWRYHFTCRKCGCNQVDSAPGFPGETINVCMRCRSVVSTDFNIKAIE